MNILHFLLDCYFTLVLGIAGIAKMDSPAFFSTTLHKQYGFSQESSKFISKVFPWIELVIAVLLLATSNVYHI